MKYYVDSYFKSLNKYTEELCGDQVRLLNFGNKTRLTLSDGLGSGVKANILATLSSEIIINMLREDVPISEVIETVVATLPVDKNLKLAYATNTLIEIDQTDLSFKIYNFDNPPVLYFSKMKADLLPVKQMSLAGRNIQYSEGQLHRGDLLVALSDGLLHAGPNSILNYRWDIEHLTLYVEELFNLFPTDVRIVVDKTVAHTNGLYGQKPSDDATMAGILVRPKQAAILFSGPPMDPAEDGFLADRVLAFEGTRIVCGGTTGNIVGKYSGHMVLTDVDSGRLDIPPMGILPGIDLMTEGIITLTSVLEWIEVTQGNAGLLPKDNSGAVQVARALLNADEVTLLVGLKVNPSYQNPDLPPSISIRKNLLEKIADRLTKLNKQVTIEFH